MAAIFGPRANLVTNAVLLALAGLAGFAAFLIWGVPRMHYNTQVSLIPLQPVPFSHQHHVSGLGIDCRYCHASVEYAPSAGMPSTESRAKTRLGLSICYLEDLGTPGRKPDGKRGCAKRLPTLSD